jgi:hypothetical protein
MPIPISKSERPGRDTSEVPHAKFREYRFVLPVAFFGESRASPKELGVDAVD